MLTLPRICFVNTCLTLPIIRLALSIFLFVFERYLAAELFRLQKSDKNIIP